MVPNGVDPPVTPFLHTRVDWAARDAYARPIPTTLPIRPVTTPVSSAGQAVMTVGVAAGLVLIAVAAVRLGRRWSTAVPALVVLGTLFAGFYEPMANVAAARLRRLLTGREQLALLCLGPFAITLGLVGTGFPELVALNTDEAATDPRYVAARARIELVSTTRDPTCGDSTPRASRCT